jgi:hypothetical protein
MGEKKSENEIAIRILGESFSLLRKMVPWAGIVWLGSYVVKIFEALAGKMTVADVDILVTALSEKDSPVWPWSLTIISIGYGYLQRREKRRKTGYLQGRIIELELRLEPDRSSSTLPADGSTREDDQ